ncbi:MAG: YHS domain protein [bacterium]|nr:YHS domain protein [bacterium]
MIQTSLSVYIRGLLPALLLTVNCMFVGIEGANANAEGVAIHGYDPVAYFTMSQAVPGDARHSVSHAGARWFFAKAEHKELFIKTPAKYMPDYGGYCAYGMAWGLRVDVDPEAWEIADDRLFLMNTKEILADDWVPERKRNIKAADDWWESRTKD